MAFSLFCLKHVEDTHQVTKGTRELQKKVPVKPLQEQVILDLEKAENVANSKIKSMSFTKDADAAAEGTETGTENAATEQSATVSVEAESTDQETAARPANGLKKLTVSLNVELTSYEDLEKFIETLESLKRIVVVEAIDYSGGEEITTLAQEKEPLTYSLTISAYYLPELNDLIAELPKIDAPAPANKKNPLSTFSDTTKAN